ncbi:MAG: alanyl-tRNA editing protein [Thermoplasmataceae archaeon]|jgi:misacylated tRNA(Ala) deacylase
MTLKLYYEDSYLKNFTSIVTGVEGNKIFLEKTAFYPAGGGQPNDTGFLFIGDHRIGVTDVGKLGDEVFHVVDDPSLFHLGIEVRGEIDWTRRYSLMRYHTAVHIIDAVVNRIVKVDGSITGSQLYPDRARVDFRLDNFNAESAQRFVDEANSEVMKERKVTVRYMTREEALQIPNLSRTAPGKELLKSLDTVRIVDIEGLDFQADGGTHVSNTKEVGKIIINGIESKGKHNKRLSFHLEP